MTRKVLAPSGLCAALLLSACGSGSSSTDGSAGVSVPPPTTSAPEGVQGSWRGNINSPAPASRQLETIVLDDGTLWMAYSNANDPTQTDALLNAAGLIRGQGTPDLSGNTFNVSAARQLSLEDDVATPVNVSATFVTGSSLGGTITRDPAAPATTLPSPASFSSLYRIAYNNNLTLAQLTGTYQGSLSTTLGKRGATLTVSPAGAVTGNDSSGCTFTGTARARSRGNVFDLNLTFGNEPGCGTNLGVAESGVLSLEAGRAGTMATDANMKTAFIFVGNR